MLRPDVDDHAILARDIEWQIELNDDGHVDLTRAGRCRANFEFGL
jgi:hypothetical protein